jgi:hypothetical protein
MLDFIFIILLITLAALLGWAAREIFRSVRRRLSAHGLFRYELLSAREGTIRHEGGGVYVRLNQLDSRDEGRARVGAGVALPGGQRGDARPQSSSTSNRKGGRTERTKRRI